MDAVADRGWSVAESSGSDAAPDAALMGRIAAGDQGAFRLVIGRHLGAVHALGWRLLRNRADAEDVAQEAFLRLWRRAADWQEGGTIAAFLLRVAYNLAIDRLRRQAPLALDDAPEPVDPAPDPAEGMAAAERERAVTAAIFALPDRQRDAILLVHQQGLGNQEAAAVMGVSVHALESLLGRGKRALRASLRPFTGEE